MRVAFHVHSDWSYDGRLSLPELSRLFASRGYDAVMLCEHCRTFSQARWLEYQEACEEASTHARVIPGIEYSDPDNVVHIPTWGLTDFAGAEIPTQEVIDRIIEQRAFAVFAHPSRRNAWQRFRPEWSAALSGYEFWNRKTDGFAPSQRWKEVEATGLSPMLALDYHSDRQRMPFVLHVAGKAADATQIMQALYEMEFKQNILGAPLGFTRSPVTQAVLRFVESGKRRVRRSQAKRSSG